MNDATEQRTANERSAQDLGISPQLLAMLVCPIDKGTLEVKDRTLVCTTCQRAYPVEDGIPNMVVD